MEEKKEKKEETLNKDAKEYIPTKKRKIKFKLRCPRYA